MSHAGEFELLVLLAILRLEDGAYGVTIRDMVEEETSRTLSLGAVYKTLSRLETKGLVRTSIAPPTKERGGRRKKLYELTAPGLAATRKSLSDLRRLSRGLEPQVRMP
jgi:DNA-binding PadR family transcriptional regulator